MKKSLHTAALPFLSLALVVAALSLSVAGNGTTTASAALPESPNVDWTEPENFTLNPLYDNTTSITAYTNDSVTIGWERWNQAGRYNEALHSSNTTLGGPLVEEVLDYAGYKENGGVRTDVDSLGRRHMLWWQYAGPGGACNFYARVGANGSIEVPAQELPDSCGANRKTTALTVGPGNVVHIAVGWIGNDLVYYQRNDGGWTVVAEAIPSGVPDYPYPESATIAVSTNNVVMVGWKDPAPTFRSDIYTAIRNGPDNWTVEDISYACCTGCPADSVVYTPSLAANYTGGFSIAWADEKCDPRTNPRTTDLYYREWVPGRGWNNQPLVRVYSGGGEAYFVSLTVDSSNKAHISWSDDSGRPSKNYTYLYTSGSGTNFLPVDRPFRDWQGSAWIKESSIAFGGTWIHTSYSSNVEDPQKEGYYSRALVHVGPPPPPPPTSTPVASATPTPGRCPGQRFNDVCPGDTFYTPIMNLVNLGVISGYSDGSFRPNNDLTRAQAAKVIALAANLPANLQGAPHFADMMDPNNAFYTYIEFAYNAGVIGGYQCGGPSEPCDAQRRAYFRPNNNVTRGQLSKMTAESFGFNEPVSGQTFEDVPANSTFYLWIERIARRSVIGGYNCGSPGEPCGPGNRPYFRPNNNVTRGQASKIIDGARLEPTATPRVTATPVPTNTAVPTSTPTSTSTATSTSTTPTVTTTVGAANR